MAGASSQAENQDEEEANPDGQEGAIQAANQALLASPLSERLTQREGPPHRGICHFTWAQTLTSRAPRVRE